MTARWMVLLLLLSVACWAGEAPVLETHPAIPDFSTPVAVAVSAARQIIENPGAAEDVLTQHGLTLAVFDELLYQIAADPALSDAYTRARQLR